jgi:hypothetical protein
MAKKNLKEAAASTSVYDAIAQGARYVPDVQDVQDVQDVRKTPDVQAVPDAQPVKKKDPRGRKPSEIPHERLTLKIPTEIKKYLQEAAAVETGKRRKLVTLTDYLCELVRADMEKHKDD